MGSRTAISIPRGVLDTIVKHKPYMKTLVEQLYKVDGTPRVQAIEKAIADNELAGVSNLTMRECYNLASCCVLRAYGQPTVIQ